MPSCPLKSDNCHRQPSSESPFQPRGCFAALLENQAVQFVVQNPGAPVTAPSGAPGIKDRIIVADVVSAHHEYGMTTTVSSRRMNKPLRVRHHHAIEDRK